MRDAFRFYCACKNEFFIALTFVRSHVAFTKKCFKISKNEYVRVFSVLLSGIFCEEKRNATKDRETNKLVGVVVVTTASIQTKNWKCFLSFASRIFDFKKKQQKPERERKRRTRLEIFDCKFLWGEGEQNNTIVFHLFTIYSFCSLDAFLSSGCIIFLFCPSISLFFPLIFQRSVVVVFSNF